MQYTFPESDQWGEGWLQSVWEDFSRGESGIVMTIWDPSRLLWFSNPVGMPNERWLKYPPYLKWGYFPIDSTGPNGKLSVLAKAAIAGFNRVLAYGLYGSTTISKSLELQEAVEFLPHGVNMEKFQPRDSKGTRLGLGVGEGKLLGVVMTNQVRKDWGLAFQTMAILHKRIPGLKVWCKTDSIDRHWDLRALTMDYGLADVVIIDLNDHTDEEMSYFYSACDLTFLPSLGEGFGYPIVESLACGVPCVHGDYGGGVDLITDLSCLVGPVAYRLDTRYNCERPVYDANDWAEAVERVLDHPQTLELRRESVSYLDWKVLRPQWEKWFKDGLVLD
jgi:glycosyltransferase involved in cell wall biosynthesis